MNIKLHKCNRCNKKMLKKKNYGKGLKSYCHYCNGFFNEENEFIEEGSIYWDRRYNYWTDMQFATLIWGVICVFISKFLLGYWGLLLILIVPFIYIVIYPKLKRENYFRTGE